MPISVISETQNESSKPASYLSRVRPALADAHLRNERVLVTGGSGFIGTNIIEYYQTWNAGALVNFDIVPPRNSEQTNLWCKVNICDASNLTAAIKQFSPTVVFHMAARADLVGDRVADYPENTDGIRNLIAALRLLPHRPRLLVASSRMVCDIRYRPQSAYDYAASNAYGESKVQTELITRQEAGNAIPWILVRPTGIWGPWFDVPYRNFFNVIRRGIYLHPRGQRTLKSYGFVGNTVYQLDRLMYDTFEQAAGQTLYLCDPPIEVLDWARKIATDLGSHPIREAPYWLLYLGAKAGDMLQALGMKHPPLTSFRLDNLTTDMAIDYMTADQYVSIGPYSLADATAITCDWLAGGHRALKARSSQ
jgi:GlcNAc-P-P-Und epimerase